ncbi:transmembrane signal receptor [Lithospermum erythrorhizon]|uniref:Transmembrane signal receptor n=1 Tax=Lithospermum erythrorhizon TaxID=34254 RepID=A0AAV3RWU6_LITER
MLKDAGMLGSKPAKTPIPTWLQLHGDETPLLTDAPREAHLKAALHVLKYLKEPPSQGLFYSRNTVLSLQCYSDADWGTCPETRRSLTGYCVYLGNSLVSWKTKKQTMVSGSSEEAEYRNMVAMTCEIQWIQYLLKDLLLDVLPIDLWCDSKDAIHITSNPVFHEHTKHLDIDCHIVRNQYLNGMIKPQHISTTSQIAELFTKALPKPAFAKLVSKLGM